MYTIVKLSAKTCHLCTELVPQFEKLKSAYQNKPVTFQEWDILDKADECLALNVTKVPNLLVLKDGKLLGNVPGAFVKGRVKPIIDDLIKTQDENF